MIGHALYPTDALVASHWARRVGRPAVFSMMGLPDPNALRRRRAWRSVIARAVRGADVAVALSSTAAERVDALFGVRCRVIHPGVDLNAFRRSADRAASPTILCPAEIGDPRKRVALLVAAFERLRENHPGARLLLSRPPAGRPVPGFVDAPGVELADLDEDDALARAYSAAWITALPSRDEAFGLVLVESLACGTPVVGSVDGGASEIVDSAAVGELVDGDDPSSLSEVLSTAIALSQQAGIEEACRQRAENFGIDRCVEAYEELYATLT